MIIRCLLILTVLFVMAGCSSKPAKPEPYFLTNVTSDGVKQFALTIDLEGRKRGGRNHDGNERKKRDRSKRDEKVGSDKRITKPEEMLDRLLDRNQFCELGYEITEQYMREGKWLARGHCNEKAKH